MKLFLSVLFAILVINLSGADAQPVLTAANTEPSVGNNFTVYVLDSLSPGSPGANQVWDYSTTGIIITDGSQTVQSYVTPSSTPFGSSFPSANLAQSDVNGNTEYYTTSNSAWTINGFGSSASITTFNGLDLLTFPLTFGDSIVNPAITGTFGTYATIIGATTTAADAYGTLILPGDTFRNLLRVVFTEIFDYHFTSNNEDQYYYSINYYWYDGVHNFPLFELSSFNTNGFQGSSFSSSVVFSSFVTGVNQVSNFVVPLTIFPNPAQAHTNINYSLKEGGETDITIFNVSGQVMYHSSAIHSQGDNNEGIDLSGFAAGIYMVEIKSNGYSGRKKLVVR